MAIKSALDWQTVKEYEEILFQSCEGIARISINRPRVHNAFTPLTVKEMSDAMNLVREDDSIGVVILTGEGGRAFCSGGDQSVRGHGGYVGTDEVPRLNVLDLQKQIRSLPKPVIAMVAGWAIGGGHVLHVICDMTIAADNARFGQTGPKVGSFDGGFGASFLARCVGQKKAREIWFLCDQYDAEDAVQMGLYLFGAVVAIVAIQLLVPAGWGEVLSSAGEAGKLQVLDFSTDPTIAYTIFAGVFGGAVFTMASHGTDQLIVQRLLTCTDQRSAQKALVGSGFAVIVQFLLFLMVGLGLWTFYQGRTFDSTDEIFATFIVEQLPAGLTGLLIAGVFAAAMSSLSSSINSLASATAYDYWAPMVGARDDEARILRAGKVFTLVWAALLIGGAILFIPLSRGTSAVEVALGILDTSKICIPGRVTNWNTRTTKEWWPDCCVNTSRCSAREIMTWDSRTRCSMRFQYYPGLTLYGSPHID